MKYIISKTNSKFHCFLWIYSLKNSAIYFGKNVDSKFGSQDSPKLESNPESLCLFSLFFIFLKKCYKITLVSEPNWLFVIFFTCIPQRKIEQVSISILKMLSKAFNVFYISQLQLFIFRIGLIIRKLPNFKKDRNLNH